MVHSWFPKSCEFNTTDIHIFKTRSAFDMETFAMQLLDPSGYYRNFVSNKVRMDGRAFSDLRRIVISGGDFNAQPSCGSSLIRWGETAVACGITIQIGTPCQQSPDCGDLGSVGCDLLLNTWPCC
jgi:hypothetical protein